MLYCFVILNWNRYDLTTSAVEDIERIEEGDYGIVVVDNNSKVDQRNELIDYFSSRGWTIVSEDEINNEKSLRNLCAGGNVRLLLLANENYGYARGNNLGLRLAYNLGYEWAVIMNNDVIIDKPVVRELIDLAISDPKIAVIGPLVIDKNGKPQGPWQRPGIYNEFLFPIAYPVLYPIEKLRYRRFRKYVSQVPISYPYRLMGCFMVVNLQALKSANWLDENTFLYAKPCCIFRS